jgi:2-polyprenyl-6-methoxyphenol hydroxylase-like FAD-dependent oxidoreductase
VLGDAFCSFNPIYGQGMTSAALGAATLGDVLKETSTSDVEAIGRRFHSRFGRILDGVWLQTTSEDLRFPQAEGRRAWWLGLANAYTARVYELSRTDPVVSRAFLEVMHLMQPPASLLRPAVLRRVLLAGMAGQRSMEGEARHVDLAQ